MPAVICVTSMFMISRLTTAPAVPKERRRRPNTKSASSEGVVPGAYTSSCEAFVCVTVWHDHFCSHCGTGRCPERRLLQEKSLWTKVFECASSLVCVQSVKKCNREAVVELLVPASRERERWVQTFVIGGLLLLFTFSTARSAVEVYIYESLQEVTPRPVLPLLRRFC